MVMSPQFCKAHLYRAGGTARRRAFYGKISMRSSRFSSDVPIENAQRDELSKQAEAEQHSGYQWTALSVTTVGALLASIQGSALLIALPNILGELHTTFFTI